MERGVRTTGADGTETDLACDTDAASELQVLEGVVPCGRDNALAMGSCDG